MKLNITLLVGVALSFPATTAALAETVRLSEITDAQAAAIERGTPWPTLACYHWSVADMIYKYGVEPEMLYVTFEDAEVNGIGVSADESGFYRTCEDGVLIEWDAGDPNVIHDFNF